ncbi:MAG: hypothetical protein M3Z21_05100, partial [Pseudomonadota bacterium]|nr:hypothetical protein [Pseudomonadota bacterium]
LSTACSVMGFAPLFEPPEVETLRQADRAEIHRHYAELLATEEQRFHRHRELALTELAARYRSLAEGVDARYLPGIRELERQQRLALNDPAAKASAQRLEEQLERERARHGRERAVLHAERRAEALSLGVTTDKARDKAVQHLVTARQAALDRTGRTDYRQDPRLRPVLLDRVQEMTAVMFDQAPPRQQLVPVLALACSVTLELAVWVALQHLALAFGPRLAAEYRRRLHRMQLGIELESELHSARLDEKLLRKRVEDVRQGLEKRMRRAVDEITA